MPLVSTDAIILHAFDYLESSRILRLLTRDAGVRSVVAKGLRKSTRRFGGGVDLFARGTAHLYTKPGRDLDTLAGFEDLRVRFDLAADMARFTGASVLAELVLRFAREAEADATLFDTLVHAVDGVADSAGSRAVEAVLAGAWRIVAALGFAPAVERCSDCHAPFAADEQVLFSHPVGGALCQRCGRIARGRLLPPLARAALATWLQGDRLSGIDEAEGRAHQRLLREFLEEHLTDGRPLRAYSAWETERWSSAI
ncbi:MAG: DNA repair protein RecO [Gemmatimonadaceae bacterium]|nr:DNA repair protein RecO [Gemmatimonadaceae bacterium]